MCRYYSKGKEGLPDAVKPHSMEKLHGLRARVIRAMFYLYPPLTSTVQTKGPMEDEPYSLKGYNLKIYQLTSVDISGSKLNYFFVLFHNRSSMSFSMASTCPQRLAFLF